MNARINSDEEKNEQEYNNRYSSDNRRVKSEYIDKDGHKVTNFKDGTSRVHFGGPCGPSDFDENGEQM